MAQITHLFAETPLPTPTDYHYQHWPHGQDASPLEVAYKAADLVKPIMPGKESSR